MLFDDTYRVIKSSYSGLYKEKGSKFISIAVAVFSEDEAKEALQKIKKEFHDARHHCYAYRIGPNKDIYRINDDGEPSGTAGKPIFGQLQSFDLTNILIVVIRYFGGVKLGVGGLIRAYKSAAQDALNQAEIETKTINDVYEVSFEYTEMNDVMRILKEEKLEQMSSDFQMSCKLTFSVRQANSNQAYERFKKFHKVSIKFLKHI